MRSHLHPEFHRDVTKRGVPLYQEDSSQALASLRVKVEANTEKRETLDPAAAKWEQLDDDVSRARVLMEHVLIQLRQERAAASQTLRAARRAAAHGGGAEGRPGAARAGGGAGFSLVGVEDRSAFISRSLVEAAAATAARRAKKLAP